MTRVYLALGANIGNRRENLRMALRLLGERCTVTAVSSLYGSKAVVLEGAAPGPEYVNAVCEAETELSPSELMAFAKEIEHRIGRRAAERWAPRPIDIDVLLCGDAVIETAELVVPHPRMSERNFVLVPLSELAPEAVHPVSGRTVGEMAEEADYEGLEHLEGPEWAAGCFDAANSTAPAPCDEDSDA